MPGSLPGDFVVGVNLPWVSYGGDFGANAWLPDGGITRPAAGAKARKLLAEIAGGGASAVRWFMLTDGRAGLRVDGGGRVLGLDDRFFADFDRALELLHETSLRAIFVLLDFTWCLPARVVEGVTLGGRARWLVQHADRLRLLDLVVSPILERHAQDAAILAWDVMNEPEMATTRRPWPLRRGRLARRTIRTFIREVAHLVHARTSHMVTVGSASASALPLVEGLGLDFFQVHWYDHQQAAFDLERPVEQLGVDRPVLLGEFPTRGSARPPRSIIAAARVSGYAGAFAWSLAGGDDASDAAACLDLRDGAGSVGVAPAASPAPRPPLSNADKR